MTFAHRAAVVQGTRKLTLNLPLSVLDKVGDLAEHLQLNRTQAIRDAIEVRHQLDKEIRTGGRIVVERENGQHVELLLTSSD